MEGTPPGCGRKMAIILELHSQGALETMVCTGCLKRLLLVLLTCAHKLVKLCTLHCLLSLGKIGMRNKCRTHMCTHC